MKGSKTLSKTQREGQVANALRARDQHGDMTSYDRIVLRYEATVVQAEERIAELESAMEDHDDEWRKASGLNCGACKSCRSASRLASAQLEAVSANGDAAKMAEWIAALLRSDQTWSLSETLGRLVLATDHLLVDHDCDAIGHEGIRQAQAAAREVMATIGRVVRSGAAGETDGGEGMCTTCGRMPADFGNCTAGALCTRAAGGS